MGVEAYAEALRQSGAFSDEEIEQLVARTGLATPQLGSSTTSPVGDTKKLLAFRRARREQLEAARTADPLPDSPSSGMSALTHATRKTAGDLSGAIVSGAQQVNQSIGGTIEAAGSAIELSQIGAVPGAGPVGRGLKKVGRFVSGIGREKAEKVRPPQLDEPFFRQLKRKPIETLTLHGLQQAPQLGAMVALGGASIPARLAPAFVLEAGAAYREALSEGASEDEAVMAAGITGVANASLEAFGAGKVLEAIKGSREGVKRLFLDVAKSMLAEGATEGVQETNNVLAGLATYAGDRGMTLNDLQSLFTAENLERIGAAGIIGSVLGGSTTVGSRLGRGGRRDGGEPDAVEQAAELVEAPPAAPQPHPVAVAENVIGSVGTERGAVIAEVQRLDSEIASLDPVTDANKITWRAQRRERLLEDARQRIGEIAESEIVGRPDLANPGAEQDVRDFSQAVQQEMKQLSEREVRHDAEVNAEAEARIAERGVPAEAQRFKADGIKSDVDAAVARRILNEVSRQALVTGDTADLAKARELNIRWYEEGTEAGRMFRQRRDLTMNPEERVRQALQDALLAPSRVLRKELADAKTDEQLAEAEAKYAREIQDSRDALTEVGLDVEAMLDPNVPMTEEVQNQILLASQLAYTGKATGTERKLEFWRNMILSAGITHMRNIVGNASFLAYELGVKQPLVAAANLVVKDPNSMTFGQLGQTWAGLFRRATISEAMHNGYRAWQTERPVFQSEAGQPLVDPISKHSGAAIKGRKGRIIRSPQRFLLFADEVAKTLTRTATLNGLAYRAAQESGDPSLQEEFFNNPTPEMMSRAIDTSVELAFQKRLGPIGEVALDARQKLPVLTFILPFVTTPGNITKESIKKSPVGILNTLRKYNKLRNARRDPDRNQALDFTMNEALGSTAEQIVAWSTAMWFLNLVMRREDDELPRITGARSLSREGREMQFRTAPPQSIRLGSRDATFEDVQQGRATSVGQPIPLWVSYAEIEPLAFPLTLAVETAEGFNRVMLEGQPFSREWEKLMGTMVSLVRDKSFFSGLSDLSYLMERVARGESYDALAEWSRNFVTSWVPNVVRSTVRASTPDLKDVKGSGQEGAAWALEQGAILGYQALPFDNFAPTRHDLWGRPIVLGDIVGHPLTDFPYRLLAPARASRVEALDVDRLIANYNATHEKRWLPSMPDRFRTIGGRKIRMNRREYQEFVRRSGTMAKERLTDIIRRGGLDVANPKDHDIKVVKAQIRASRKVVFALMFGEGVFDDDDGADERVETN